MLPIVPLEAPSCPAHYPTAGLNGTRGPMSQIAFASRHSSADASPRIRK